MNEPDDDSILLDLYRRHAQEQPRAAIDRRILARARQRDWRPALAAAAVLLLAGIMLLDHWQRRGASLAEQLPPPRPALQTTPLGSASTRYLLQADWRPGADQTTSDIAAAPCPSCNLDTFSP